MDNSGLRDGGDVVPDGSAPMAQPDPSALPRLEGRGSRDETPLAFRAVRGGLWVAASSYLNFGVGFLANLALTRILSPEDFGVFALATFFFSLANIRPKVGIGQAFGQTNKTTGQLIGSHLALDITAGLATLVLAVAAIPILRAVGYSWDVAWVVLALAVVGISDSIMGTAWVLLDRELRFRETSVVSSLVFPLSYVPAFWLALNGGGYWSLVAQGATYAVLLLLGLWWTARRRLPHIWQFRWQFDRRAAMGLLRFGTPVGLAMFAGTLLLQFDNFLVGTFVGIAALGFYERAYRIAQWPSLLVNSAVTRTAFYTYARLQDDRERLRKTVTMSCWLITTLTLPMALAVFIAAPDLVRVLYGDRWLPSAVLLRFLVVYSVVRPFLENAGSLFTAVGRPRLNTLTVGIEAATLIVTGVPLTIHNGVLGTCVAVGLAFGVGLFVRTGYVRQIVALSIWEALLAPGLAAAVTLAVYLLLNRVVGTEEWPLMLRAVAKALYGALMFLGVLGILRPRSTLQNMRYTWQLALARGGRQA